MSTAMIANLVEELKTSDDKIAKAAELEALLTSLDASIEVKDVDYDRMITGGGGPNDPRGTSNTMIANSQCCPPATQPSC